MTTPIRSNHSTYPGSVLVHVKWKNTKLVAELKNKFNKVIYKHLGRYDFGLAGDKFIIFVPEHELVTSHVNPDKFNDPNVIVIAVRNRITSEQYSKLQDSIVVGSNCILIPVTNAPVEVPELLHQLSVMDVTPRKPTKPESQVSGSTNLLLTIPRLGKSKAEKLLGTFGTIHRLSRCSTNELTTVVGSSLAGEIYKYFH